MGIGLGSPGLAAWGLGLGGVHRPGELDRRPWSSGRASGCGGDGWRAGLGPGEREVLAFLGVAGGLDRCLGLGSRSRSSVGPVVTPASVLLLSSSGRDQVLAVGVQPAVDLGGGLEHELGLLDGQLDRQGTDPGDRRLDPVFQGPGRSCRGSSPSCRTRPGGSRPAGTPLAGEQLHLPGADLEGLRVSGTWARTIRLRAAIWGADTGRCPRNPPAAGGRPLPRRRWRRRGAGLGPNSFCGRILVPSGAPGGGRSGGGGSNAK